MRSSGARRSGVFCRRSRPVPPPASAGLRAKILTLSRVHATGTGPLLGISQWVPSSPDISPSRTVDIPPVKAVQPVVVRFPREELEAIDRARCGEPRTAFIRRVLAEYVQKPREGAARVAGVSDERDPAGVVAVTPPVRHANALAPAREDAPGPVLQREGESRDDWQKRVSEKTGHFPGCGCLNCERARGSVSG